ncbi:MAG: cytochrome c [Alteromonas stellipolaris]|uniref:c-type cytochrome n=1 Tax=Alteromonas stellipolaris TaxID=233316 RepID=UPI003B8BA180
MKKLTYAMTVLVVTMVFSVNGNELDTTLRLKSQDVKATQQGQKLFEQICASCHAKDLSGGTGFNLKDGEWVHGSAPSQILSNVKTGFLNAGMPGFEQVFDATQIEAIVAYVLSKREGWDNLTYKLYQLNGADDTDVTADKLIKSGELAKGLADFAIPEVQHYFIEFEGDFYAPKDLDTQVWLQWGFPHELKVYINHKQVTKGGTAWFPTWRLERGKQHLKVTYRSGDTKPNQRDLILIGTNLDLTVKLFPLSSKAKNIVEEKKFELKASDHILIQRKRILDLPPSTISVGFPTKLNYGFNTKTCAVVGLWQGDMLNVGPNIAGRGEDPSLPLGEWVFHAPEQLQHVNEEHKCHYKGYRLENGNPVFSYTLGGQQYALSVETKSSNTLNFIYSITGNQPIKLKIPETSNWQWTHGLQPIERQSALLTPKQNGRVVVTAKATATVKE